MSFSGQNFTPPSASDPCGAGRSFGGAIGVRAEEDVSGLELPIFSKARSRAGPGGLPESRG